MRIQDNFLFDLLNLFLFRFQPYFHVFLFIYYLRQPCQHLLHLRLLLCHLIRILGQAFLKLIHRVTLLILYLSFIYTLFVFGMLEYMIWLDLNHGDYFDGRNLCSFTKRLQMQIIIILFIDLGFKESTKR